MTMRMAMTVLMILLVFPFMIFLAIFLRTAVRMTVMALSVGMSVLLLLRHLHLHLLQLCELFRGHSLHLFQVLSEGCELVGRGRLIGAWTMTAARDTIMRVAVLLALGLMLVLVLVTSLRCIMRVSVFWWSVSSAFFSSVAVAVRVRLVRLRVSRFIKLNKLRQLILQTGNLLCCGFITVSG